jgi:uncharacterized protein
MKILRSSDYRRMPWKNGGGETVEIAVEPPGASLDGFDWRVSMARVASSGPFSMFAGVDRTLAVLDGRGVRLSVAGRGMVALGPDTPPFAFPADVPAEATLIDGAIDDLNVMTRRARYRHRLIRVPVAEPLALTRECDVLLVVVRGAAAAVKTASEEHALAAGDTLVLEQPGDSRAEIAPTAAATLYVVELWRSV